MKHGVIAIAGLALLPASCASRDAVHAPAQDVADYNPGPWSILFDGNSDRPAPGSKPAFLQIAFMASRFPAVGVALCYIGREGLHGLGDQDKVRVQAVRDLLSRAGVRRIADGSGELCEPVPYRSEPFVWVVTVID